MKSVDAWPEKLRFTAVSRLVITNVIETPEGTVRLLLFAPFPLEFVAGLEAVPFTVDGITNAS